VLDIQIKRIYDPPGPEDGLRILVDRLWPRGVGREHAAVDLWMKELAPSTALRTWFGHNAERWEEFCLRYVKELSGHSDLVDALHEQAQERRVTLLYAARSDVYNNAACLQQYLVARQNRLQSARKG